MSSINYDLKKIRAFVFDIDGVLSRNVIPLASNGDPMRTVCIKDGYAMQLAVKKGYQIAIITGAYTESVKIRYERLGVKYIFLGSSIKMNDYLSFMSETGLNPEEVAYAGDDIPDFEVMKLAGLPIAPADAAPEIKSIAKYISSYNGGDGVARDIIEQTLKVHGDWMDNEAFGW